LALHHIHGVGPAKFKQILVKAGSIQRVFEQPTKLSVSDSLLQQLLNPDWDFVEAELEWAKDKERHIVTLGHAQYPELLKQCDDAPVLLYVQGDVNTLSQWQVAVVGSRNPSDSGKQSAFEFSRYLAERGIVITSGLATGVDAAAHKGALAAGGKTIAVVGTGLDRVYPAKHRELAHDIAANGAIVSEFMLGTSPKAENFPRRNRIISGLSLGTLVVEAALQSGSLITARLAMEQAREVFAIPGSIHNPMVKGCHKLIREGAKLVETADDILEELGPLALAQTEFAGAENKLSQQDANIEKHDEEYQLLLDKLGYDPISIDVLVERSGLTAEAVSSMLLLLELEDQVESFSGGRYARKRAPS
jgi:DNA processing protein